MFDQYAYNNDAMHGFGKSSRQDLDEIRKAITSGYGMINQTGGDALRVQSLEATLKILTYTSDHIKLFKKIDKGQAYSTVEEYTQLTSYGTRTGGFLRAGELPQSSDPSFVRQSAYVKYIGTVREVDHPMTLVTPAHGDAIALQNYTGVLWLLERIEHSLFHGDSSLAFSGEAEMWDGLDSMIDASNYIDLAGSPMTETDLEDAAFLIADNYGIATDVYWGFKNASDFMKIFYPRERVNLPAPQNGRAGYTINAFDSQFGPINLNSHIFLRGLPQPPAAATHVYAPATPGAISHVSYGADDTAEWSKLLGTPTGATTFSYAVTASNRFGESAPSFLTTTVTLAAALGNQMKNMTVANASPIGANPPEFFSIYRSRPGVTSTTVSDFSHIMNVAASSQTAAATTAFVDRNFLIPFTHMAYVGEFNSSVLTMKQLLPLFKMDLAMVAPAYRWVIMYYGVPILMAPLKMGRIINIGEL